MYLPPSFGFRTFISSLASPLPQALACPTVPPGTITHPNRSCAHGHVLDLITGNAVLHQDANGRLMSWKANPGREAVSRCLLEDLHAGSTASATGTHLCWRPS